MKNLMICVAAMLVVTFTPIQSHAENNPTSTTSTEKEKAEVKALIDRINEINAMDRSTMSPSERKRSGRNCVLLKRKLITGMDTQVVQSTFRVASLY